MKASIRLSRRGGIGLALALILAALALGFVLFRSSATTSILVAASDLASGQTLNPTQVTTTEIRLSTETTGYLKQLPSNLVLTHAIRKGQLLNANDFAEQSNNLIHLAIEPTTPIATDVHVGAEVSIWYLPDARATETTSSMQIADHAQVISIKRNTDSFGTTKLRIEVELAQELVPAMLLAQSQNGNLIVVAQN